MVIRVLFVEDEHKIAAFIKRGLEESAYAVDVAYDGEQGYDWAKSCDYDFIICERIMGLIFGRNQTALQKKLQGNTVESMWRRGFVAGTPSQIVDQLSQLEEAGVQKVMLQWTDLDDIAGLETLADFILPQLQTNTVVGHTKKEVISDQQDQDHTTNFPSFSTR